MEKVVDAKTLSQVGKKVKAKRNVERLLEEIPMITRNKVYSHWDSLDLNSKKEFQRIEVDDFTSHFKMPENLDCELGIFVSQVWVRACARKNWIAWVCISCEDITNEFDDSESYKKHLVTEHAKGLQRADGLMQRFWPKPDELQFILMMEMILQCSWKPLDISAAIEMLESRVKLVGDSITETIQDWPLSNDSKRAELLKRIKDKFDVIFQIDIFTPSQLTHIIDLAKDEIFGLIGSHILGHALDQSVDWICFLEAPGLWKVLKFLEAVIKVCGTVLNLNKSSDTMNDIPHSIQFPADIKEEIHLSEDSTVFLLDGCLVTTTGSTAEGAIVEDVISDIDSFLPWIFSGSCIREWERWGYEKSIKTNQALALLDNLENFCAVLLEHLDRKCKLENYGKALKVVEDLCHEEVANENFTESILRERKEELSNTEEHVRDTFVLDVIIKVLEKAQKLKVEGSNCDKSYIKMAIEKQKLGQSGALAMIDGVIAKSNIEMNHSITELSSVARFDYRLGFLPLVKAYLKARLVASFEREAKMKSDAIGDALLSELAKESKQNIKERSDSAKYSKKKTTNKKSTKQSRKMNKLKAKNDDDLILAELAEELEATTYEKEQHDVDTAMVDHSSAAHDEKSPNQVRLEEIEDQKKKFAETEKELEAAEKLIEEMTTELEEKRNLHAQELRELQNEDKDEENIKNALKNHAEKVKELEAEEKFIQDMVKELREKHECLFKKQKLLAIDEERIKTCLFWSHLKK